MAQEMQASDPDIVDAPAMIQAVEAGPLAWTDDSLPADAGIVPVTEACLDELIGIARILEANPVPTVALKPADFDAPACRDMMAVVRDTLENGVGFVILDRLPVEDLGPEAATQLYWLLGNMIGNAVAQKWDGTMIYDVRDTGRTMTPGNGVRSSITNAGQTFHTDNSFNLPPEYVALLCIRPSMEGGLSGVASFQTVHNRLLEKRPELLKRLYEPFWFDRQREHAPDDPNPVNRWPVFRHDENAILTRFSTRLIFGGHEVAGEPLDDVGREAVEVVASMVDDPGICREFAFEPGQIQILNNRRLGHRRTAFRDWPDSERRRHLVRLWFRNSGRRFYAG